MNITTSFSHSSLHLLHIHLESALKDVQDVFINKIVVLKYEYRY